MERLIFQKKKKMFAIAKCYGLSIATMYRIQAGTASKKNPKYAMVRRELAALTKSAQQTPAGLSIVFVTQNAHSTSHTVAFYQAAEEYCAIQEIQLIQVEEKNLFEFLSSHSVDGIISLCILQKIPKNIPLVYLNCHSLFNDVSSVCVAGMENWFRMIQYLRDTGSKRIGVFLPGDPTPADTYYTRKGAFQKEIFYIRTGMERDSDLLYSSFLEPANYKQVMNKVADHFLSLPEPPDAIVVETDYYLSRIAMRLQKSGSRLAHNIRLSGVYGIMDRKPSISITVHELNEEYKWIKDFPIIYGEYPCLEMTQYAIQQLIEKIRGINIPPHITEFSTKIIDTKMKGKQNGKQQI